MSEFAPIRGKCFYWREHLNEDDKYDTRVEKGKRRVECSCFVEGDRWTYFEDEVPAECPVWQHCRYHIPFS
ncbi:MAG: hypothetical protein JXA36_06540 [Coriobacteriia bacterium]|nr:hypothetical protein [Coriobacteriia bacterium]